MDDEEDTWFTVALVVRSAPDVMQDLIDVVQGIPGTMLVFKRVSRAKLYITDRDPRGGWR